MEYHSSNGLNKTGLMVFTALLFALAIVLATLENMLPALPIAVPGVKFGLSNIAVMYALFFVRKRQAFMIAILKSVYVVATRGMMAGVLSLSGGILSLVVMIALMLMGGEKTSYFSLSIAGAIFHNIGQFIAISLIYTAVSVLAYLPVLLVSGVFAGIATATLLRCILPAFEKLGLKFKKQAKLSQKL